MSNKLARLSLVIEPPFFKTLCQECGAQISENDRKVADLEGRAYVAYYHLRCLDWAFNLPYPMRGGLESEFWRRARVKDSTALETTRKENWKPLYERKEATK